MKDKEAKGQTIRAFGILGIIISLLFLGGSMNPEFESTQITALNHFLISIGMFILAISLIVTGNIIIKNGNN